MAAFDTRLPEAIFRRSPGAPSEREVPSRPGDPRPARRAAAPLPAAPPPGLLQPGTILDKYRIEELVGTGGFGAVYRATHLVLRSTVAIKHVLPSVIARRPDVVAELIEEARCAACIQHTNVVRVLDATKSSRLTYIVMELIEGPTLARAIKSRGRFDKDEVVGIGIDVARGLQAGLENGVIHRDVKPSNIVLAKGGQAKIVDLGLARATAMSKDRPARSVVGTRGYIAPEQFVAPERADHRADMYSLGITLTEALTGHVGAGVPVETPASSHRLRMVLDRMTRRDPVERFATYDEVIDALARSRSRRSRR
jgi:serine/threonine-protein kinase